MIYRKAIVLNLIFFLCFPAFAQVLAPFSKSLIGGSEYFVGRDLGKPLITVNLINGVTKPGVYHIPVDTDLARLLSYAGGSKDTSDLQEVSIRRTENKKESVSLVDLEYILKSDTPMPKMYNRDVVHIAQKESLDSTLKWISIFSGIATMALTLKLVSDGNK
ncbi:MAG: hypothetical protein HOO06_15530 [Bdellovibrionaceae bacterium]|jgi:hypothetical protein|nr:hypothetical protein [Pseudobdellovibrionaceae bacterium]